MRYVITKRYTQHPVLTTVVKHRSWRKNVSKEKSWEESMELPNLMIYLVLHIGIKSIVWTAMIGMGIPRNDSILKNLIKIKTLKVKFNKNLLNEERKLGGQPEKDLSTAAQMILRKWAEKWSFRPAQWLSSPFINLTVQLMKVTGLEESSGFPLLFSSVLFPRQSWSLSRVGSSLFSPYLNNNYLVFWRPVSLWQCFDPYK